jgi:hypothetical protein
MLTVKNGWISLSFAASVLFFISAFAAAGEKNAPKSGPNNSSYETVEMFKAIEDGQIAVKFIPKNSKIANVFIENKTDKP